MKTVKSDEYVEILNSIMNTFGMLYLNDFNGGTVKAVSELKLTQMKIFFWFGSNGSVSVKQLSDTIGMKSSVMAMTVNDLIDDGLAEQVYSFKKSNEKRIRLTRQGKKIQHNLLVREDTLAKSIYLQLNSVEKAMLLTAFNTASRILGNLIEVRNNINQ